jgi:hypothetical protein
MPLMPPKPKTTDPGPAQLKPTEQRLPWTPSPNHRFRSPSQFAFYFGLGRTRVLTLPHRLLGGLVEIQVGKGADTQVFHVHKGLLSKQSAFFNAAIDSGFREKVENKIVLKDKGDDPLTFEFFLTWLYTGSLPSVLDYISISVARQEDVEFLFLRLFAMADRFLAPDLKNLSYLRLREVFGLKMIPTAEWVEELYEVTTPQCQLREYIVASCVHNLRQIRRPTNWYDVIEASESFAADISKVFAREKPQSGEKIDTHPYEMEQYRQLRQRAAIASAWYSAEVRPGQPNTDLVASDDFRAKGSKTALNPLIEQLNKNIENAACEDFRPIMTAKWPHKNLSTEAMRRAGWYHHPEPGKLDRVRCLHCGSEAYDWGDQARPFWEHQQKNEDCAFVEAVDLGLKPPLLPYFYVRYTPRRTKKSD